MGSSTNDEVHPLEKRVTELVAAVELLERNNVALQEAIKEASGNTLPIGSIVAFAGLKAKIPKNWRLCDGGRVFRNEFPILFERLGTTWGKQDGCDEDEFFLPDCRSRFLRGDDGGSDLDPERKDRDANGKGEKAGLGTTQEDAFQDHKHADEGHQHGGYGLVLQDCAAGGDRAKIQEISCNPAGPKVYHTGCVAAAQITKATEYDVAHPLRASSETRPKNVAIYFIIRVL